MQKKEWKLIEVYLVDVLAIVRPDLAVEATETIVLYLEHGEYEICFECLFLEIMNLNMYPPIDFTKGLYIGKLLKLDEETVFDIDFWIKFNEYVLRQPN